MLRFPTKTLLLAVVGSFVAFPVIDGAGTGCGGGGARRGRIEGAPGCIGGAPGRIGLTPGGGTGRGPLGRRPLGPIGRIGILILGIIIELEI